MLIIALGTVDARTELGPPQTSIQVGRFCGACSRFGANWLHFILAFGMKSDASAYIQLGIGRHAMLNITEAHEIGHV